MQENVMTVKSERLGYSVKELSKAIGICERKIWQDIKDNKLKAARFGNRVVITIQSAQQWITDAETNSANDEK